MKLLTRLVINLDQLNQNISNILSYKQGDFMFVLKGNAYGHGYIEIVQELNKYEKIKFYGVSSCLEAKIISPYTDKKIIVLGYTQTSCFDVLSNSNIIPSVSRIDDLIRIQNQDIFINVDTGFHRLGVTPSSLNKEKINQHKNIIGIFTHLKLCSENSDLDQINIFKEFTHDLNIKYKSISDSIAYTRYNTPENLYRIGALMFGLTSVKENNKIDVKPITSFLTKITRIEHIKKDSSAFYKSSIKKGMVIATIQVGYGDGLFRDMKDSYVVINKEKCNYIEVGMDQSIVDISGVDCNILDDVVLFGHNGISLEHLCTLLHTNKNNIMTSISARVTRKYTKNGTVKYINTYGVLS
jgi:alanine racemase